MQHNRKYWLRYWALGSAFFFAGSLLLHWLMGPPINVLRVVFTTLFTGTTATVITAALEQARNRRP